MTQRHPIAPPAPDALPRHHGAREASAVSVELIAPSDLAVAINLAKQSQALTASAMPDSVGDMAQAVGSLRATLRILLRHQDARMPVRTSLAMAVHEAEQALAATEHITPRGIAGLANALQTLRAAQRTLLSAHGALGGEQA